MCSDVVIRARNLSKAYHLYERPADRLRQFLWRGRRQFFRDFWALRDVNLEIFRGEVIGIIGRNGAGKSTLLQMICGTVNPSHGEIAVTGRVAALLELGAGFNPEYSGRENVFMNGAILGLDEEEIKSRYDEIVEFSEIGAFINQPVKTYSSGMFVRLAFAIATSVDPDILVIDEALSVGDGAFSRKSFDRIMALKDAGKTILFCSHSMYQVEAICSRAIWLDGGQIQQEGLPHQVVMSYNHFIEAGTTMGAGHLQHPADNAALPTLALAEESTPLVGIDEIPFANPTTDSASTHGEPVTTSRTARIVGIKVSCDGISGLSLSAHSRKSELVVEISFSSDPTLPTPSAAIVVESAAGTQVASAGSRNDGVELRRDDFGRGIAIISFPSLPLLKGEYLLSVYLLCERAVHVYELAHRFASIKVFQQDLEIGITSLPHHWQS